MNQLLSVGLIAVIAIGILFLSQIRKKRIQPYIDAFATAFCEVSEHILPKEGIAETLAVKPLEAGRVRALPKEQQPEPIRALIEKGIDEYALERLRTMFAMRMKAQEHLSSFNLIGKKINGVLNSTYDLVNLSLSIIHDPSIVKTADDVNEFRRFTQKQRELRTKTLASVASEEWKEKYAA